MLCHLLTPIAKCQSSFICHLVQILVHVVNIQKITFLKISVFPGSIGMSKNYFKGLEVVRDIPACMEHWPDLLSHPLFEVFLVPHS